MPRVGFRARRAQTSLFFQPSQLGTIECNGMPREVSTVFFGFLGTTLPSNLAVTVEVHRVRPHSERIGIHVTMKNSLLVMHVDGIRK
ncbi:hypothetical protein DVH24_034716 [Malus domestica]|uniref:Uncharacterized protein n=1 Tax=Malus domestica TaxID=3750 RepID=A0A498IXB3_MALDO|nr:hypothetical protein DVH24_034716 [Malus domestica]